VYREVAAVCELPTEVILNVPSPAEVEEISRVRRRFAAVFHPDRVKQLPVWAQQLCDSILSAVNQACDRASG